MLLKEVKIVEYYRRELMRAYSRQVNEGGNNNLLTSIYDEMDHRIGRGSVQSHQAGQGGKGTLAGVQDMFKKFFGQPEDLGGSFSTPSRRFMDVVRPNSRAADFFTHDIPDVS